ncbi:hypothetical protein PLICRDRAFT_47067 [Plicaturopsis crispa FD-325 SS-3]|uniref:Uncharacterized protein n=1 Tax=Plicaturopsis crispa FD-325 SS-3 TaxID=944288 RepID=A0A0C9SWB8_PLICR|nr:hypothetical protein PLICRDRAFT_47067 [Plicaturopsis crispa FD-325 SS-3]
MGNEVEVFGIPPSIGTSSDRLRQASKTGLGIYTEGPPLGRRAQPETWVQVSFTGPESRHNNESWLGRGPCTQGPPQ